MDRFPSRADQSILCCMDKSSRQFFRSVSRTHIGHVRRHNEDRFVDRSDIGLWAIADGMGGSDGGDRAAQKLATLLEQVPPTLSARDLLARVRDAIVSAHESLLAEAMGHGGETHFGSTIVALVAHQGFYMCLWAGDSRAYLLRKGRLHRLTTDHSLVQEMVAMGALAPEAAAGHRRANIITRAVGLGALIELDQRHGRIVAGDIFLLCSDGLTGLVRDSEIEAALRTDSLEGAADWLIATVLERGAHDNVSLVIAGALA
jgi:serine/threonine protein phosphatase Stp1